MTNAETVLPEIASKGSQRWLQLAVNDARGAIDPQLRTAVGAGADVPVDWRSPLRAERFVEYRDETFVTRLDLRLRRPLSEFWPARGPMWDGLATVGDARVLIEAKAHVREMISGATRASGESKAMIEKAVAAARRFLAPRNEVEWSQWNGAFYQYVNRLAHLQFLRDVADAPVHLVYVYFLNATDVGGPVTIDEWRGAIKLMEGYLGLGSHRLQRFVHDVFVDVREVCEAAGVPFPG